MPPLLQTTVQGLGGSEWFVPPRWQTVCRLSRPTRITPDWKAGLVFVVRALSCAVRQPTHSLPPGRRRTIWYGVRRRGYVKRVRRQFRALATNVGHVIAV